MSWRSLWTITLKATGWMLGHLVITFDTEYLTFLRTTPGDFFAQYVPGAQNMIWIEPDIETANNGGRVDLNFGVGGASPHGISGDGVLAILRFRTKQRVGKVNIGIDDSSELRNHNDRKMEDIAFFGMEVTIK